MTRLNRTTRVVAFAVTFGFFSTMAFPSTDISSESERPIQHLQPSTFSKLPLEIVKALKAKGCSIPQAYNEDKPHNFIRGSFAKKDQTDWAVLCSRSGRSSILVFWGDARPCPAEVDLIEDKNYLQTVNGEGKTGYSRLIATKQIAGYEQDGLDNAFVGKASTTYVCKDRKWQVVGGSD